MTVTHPYVTAQPFFGLTPQWMTDDDARRVESYRLYHNLYWANPDTLRIQLPPGNESEQVIHLPDPRTIVNTTAHYVTKGLTTAVENPEANTGDADALKAFLTRERFTSKFMVAKRQGVAFGDWTLHLTGDPDAPAGARLSLNTVDPGEFFPVWDDDDLDRKEAVHLARQEVVNPGTRDETVVVRRKTYRYVRPGRGLNREVWVSEALFDPEDWFKRGGRPTRVILEPTRLPTAIQTIPVYHFRNQPWRGDPFGSSELRGFEALQRAIDQTLTDEQLAIRLEGNGVYVTDAPPPQNPDGTTAQWEVAPGAVLQVSHDRRFERVQGVTSVTPFLNHVDKLQASLWEAAGVPEVARGRAEVTAVESGIALAIQFNPMLAKIEDRDAEALDVLGNFWFDWARWLEAFEGYRMAAPVATTLGDKLPLNVDAFLDRLLKLLEARVVSRRWVRDQVRTRLGFDIPEGIEKEVLAEASSMAEVFDLPGAGRADIEAGEEV